MKPPSSWGSPKWGVVNSTSTEPVGGRGGEEHAHDGEEHADPEQDRERAARTGPAGRGPTPRARRCRSPAPRRPGSARARCTRRPPVPTRARRRRARCAGAATPTVGARPDRVAAVPRVCVVLVTSLGCPLDSGCAQPGCCVRSLGSGPGTGEVGARPTLTRNCERLCGYPPHSVSQATCRCPPGHRCSQKEPLGGGSNSKALVERGRRRQT